MNRFGAFLEFCGRHVDGSIHRDQAYKNYDLMYMVSDNRLRKALAECGFKNDEIAISLDECAARSRERGYELGQSRLQQYLLEWYVWRRISEGEYRKWKYR